jgi:hypothetical protein
MPCSDGGKEHGVEKQYLDVRKPEARRFFVQKAVEWARIPGISAMQYDDHVGYFLAKLPCSQGAASALSNGLDLLVKETHAAVKQANPRIRFEFSHHNAHWARSNFAVNWPNWMQTKTIDGMYTQAYTAANVGVEIEKAKASGVKGLGLQNILGNDQSGATLLKNTQSTLQAGLGVIFFKWPNLNTTERARLRQLLGGLSYAPRSTEASSRPTGEEAVYETQNGLEPNVCLPSDTQERRIRYAGYCTSNEGELEANFDGCERSTCAASGGGMACTEKSKWSRSFFCRVLVPKIVGPL